METPIVATPPLQFTYQPIVLDNTMLVPLEDLVKNISILKTYEKPWIKLSFKDQAFLIKPNSIVAQRQDGETIDLPYRTFTISQGKYEVTFVPLRAVAQHLLIPVEVVDNNLFINNQIWETGTQKLIAADLEKQRVCAFEGTKLAMSFRICSGKPSTPTPTGIFEAYKKWPGWHSWKATEAVPYDGKMYNAIYFHGGAAFHGVESGNMRKRPSSHGCCRMFTTDSDLLYAWTPGKPEKDHLVPKKDRITVYVF